jgi:formylglycine-generating enzyme required for sulfatase activity
LVPQSAGKFQIQCWINQSFEIQCSSDLTTWSPVTTVTNETGTLIFEDVEADQHECRYYRVVEARPNMVWIPPGTFLMGSPEDEVDRQEDEGPQTQVTLTQGFYMGKHEVTQGEYLAVMGNNPSWFNGVRPSGEGQQDYGTDLTRPVEQVNWDEAVAYCGALTERERAAGHIPMNYAYRLPTEAEWEYTCRAGTTTRFSHGDDPGYTNLTHYAWYAYDGNSDEQTHPVGQKLPNPWGLYDMHGSVFEWCQDWWAENLPGGIALDAQGPDVGPAHVLRGGDWGSGGELSRSSFRFFGYPGGRRYDIGFRVVLAPGLP